MIFDFIKKERDNIITKIQDLKTTLETFPESNLLCVRNGCHTKWYISNGTKPIYIPKKNRELAVRLARKKFYRLQLEELSQECKILDKCLVYYDKERIKSTSLLEDSSGYRELLESYFKLFPDKIQQWISETYEQNPIYPEHLIHKTYSGHYVRSKSEVIIANALFTNKIPYRYEYGLHFENTTFHPDFTICHPRTMEVFYWEHFGMMDNPSYCENTYNKFKTYGHYGILPSINLITTYETLSHPINSEKIQRTIQEYFL